MATLPPPTPRLLEQVAALPVRTHAEGFVEVLLVTSRETRRWIIPKGWPSSGLEPHEAAAKEAMEEAGVVGIADRHPLGHFTYDKRLDGGIVLPCRVAVHLLQVERQLDRWREQGQRDCAWLPAREAAKRVCNMSLQRLIMKAGRSPDLAGKRPTAKPRRTSSALHVF